MLNTVRRLSRASVRTVRQEGVGSLVRKATMLVRGRVGDTAVAAVSLVSHRHELGKLPLMPQLADVLTVDLDKPAATPSLREPGARLSIVWVTPPVGARGGGHTTISRFAKYFQAQGHDVSFAVYENNTMPQTSDAARAMLKKSYGLDVDVVGMDELGGADVIIATSWETAYGVYNAPDTAHKFYFVQDFEPSFFGVGSRYKLAEATYRFGFYGITAGKWLTQRVAEYGMEADWFDFGADLDVYAPPSGAVVTKKKQIAFYARPSTERRGFELGMLALEVFANRHPEYEIVIFGSDLVGWHVPFPHTNLGLVEEHQLAEIYHESVACLVLSLTNVSLLPLELVAAGCVAVVNEGENNTMVLGHVDGIEYTDALPTSLAAGLSRAVERADAESWAAHIAASVGDRSWQQGVEKVEKIIVGRVTGVAA
ncbi:glycosyltransferase family 1 protein [Xylanimonas protaetiae]|uniref:Glycosyltransferase family 1 protein n=2 Tax=Xylanimonas protaetiae TaxID=2509457 RepID=A0A4P6FM31_9MICO|nr:glycosyltransferase family 1 protein [Xylanimonas protaetiae]